MLTTEINIKDMQKLVLFLSFLLFLLGSKVHTQNAPISTIQSINSCPGTTIDIPITVSDFSNIGAISLTMHYDPAVLSYISSNNNSGFPNMIINGAEPGKVVISAHINFNDPGVDLPDNSILFTLTFHLNGGTTLIEWFDDGITCEYANAVFYPLNDSPTSTYYINGLVESSFPLNAPITTAPNVETCPGTYIDIPITVSEFCNIGALSLTLNYNSSVLNYDSFINDSGFPGLVINGSLPGEVYAGGFINPGDPGVSLPDNAVLFTLRFFCIGGYTDLEWFDDGISCEYTDALFNPLNDTPTSAYYIDGLVLSSSPVNAPITTVPDIETCPGTYIDIPVTISEFCNIGAISLTLNYN